jgi:hypothetical protein
VNNFYKNKDITEEEYRKLDFVSSSVLMQLAKGGINALKKREEEDDDPDSRAIVIGKVTETLLLESDKLKDKFYISEIEKPTASLLVLANEVIKICKEKNIKIDSFNTILEHFNLVSETCKTLGLWNNIKNNDTWVNKWNLPVLWKYLEVNTSTNGKVLVSPQEHAIAQELSLILKNHVFTNNIFTVGKDEEVFVQHKLIFPYEKNQIKTMIDFIKVNHEKKEIYSYDVKTGWKSPELFSDVYYFRRYDIQEAIYTKALYHNYPDYKVYHLKFIYISSSVRDYNYPIIAESIRPHIETFTGYFTKSGRWMKGINELLQDYNFYKKNNEIPREIYDNSGRLLIKVI